jgi:hypothetical protein
MKKPPVATAACSYLNNLRKEVRVMRPPKRPHKRPDWFQIAGLLVTITKIVIDVFLKK